VIRELCSSPAPRRRMISVISNIPDKISYMNTCCEYMQLNLRTRKKLLIVVSVKVFELP
jgi:hypothetical protein